MAQREKWFVIAYDVRVPKRVQRIYKCLRKEAYALHESVFLFRGTMRDLEMLKGKIRKVIKASEDDVRIYNASSKEAFVFIGRELTSNGIIVEDLPKFVSLSDDKNLLDF